MASPLSEIETASDKRHRLETSDIETGIANALQRHVTRHVAPAPKVTQTRLEYERKRPRWLKEMIAEAIGVFIFV